jgi:hypothetical protein
MSLPISPLVRDCVIGIWKEAKEKLERFPGDELRAGRRLPGHGGWRSPYSLEGEIVPVP